MFKMTWIFVAFFLWFATFSPSERVALGSAFLVLIGVIGEYVVEIHAVEKRERLKNGIKRFSMAILVLGLCGDVLGIVMGQAEMAVLTKQAGDAATSAHNAAIDAGNATIASQSAQEKADVADVASGDAMKKSNTADKAASEALNRVGTVKWYVDILAKTVNPRILDRKVFLDALAGKPKGAAAIWYEPNDPEANFLATQIHSCLGPQGAGWQVEDTKPLSEAWDSNNFVYGERMSPLDKERIGANLNSVGVSITGSKFSPLDNEGKTAFGALTLAIMRGTGEHHWGVAYGSTTDPSLPDDHFVILVGHHRVNIPLWTAPWQNPLPAPINTKHASKPKARP
jgi:hypothetical protein